METPDYKLLSEVSELRPALLQIEYFSNQFLPFISRTIPDFSSHGYDHSMGIIKNINDFTDNWPIDLIEPEAFLMYAAAWTHDIGCIRDRIHHEEISASIILENNVVYEVLPDPFAYSLKYIILSHRSRYNLNDIEKEYGGIRLRMICAIFRLMDACAISYVRCPDVVYRTIGDTLGDESRKYWIGHMNIKGLSFREPEIIVLVNHREKCQFLIDDLQREIDSIAQTFREYSIPIPKIQIK